MNLNTIRLRTMLIEKFGEKLSDDMAEFLCSEEVLQQMHMLIEDFLIDMRDSRISVFGPANGFVVREADGTPSSIVRIGTRDGLRLIMNRFKEEKYNDSSG